MFSVRLAQTPREADSTIERFMPYSQFLHPNNTSTAMSVELDPPELGFRRMLYGSVFPHMAWC